MDFFKKLFSKQAAKGGAERVSTLSILPEQIYKSASLELQDVIAPSALKIEPKSINLGEKIARTFFIISYPRFLTDNWFSPVINLDKVFDISIFVHPIDTALMLRQFQKKVAEVQSQINVRETKGMVRDPMLDAIAQVAAHDVLADRTRFALAPEQWAAFSAAIDRKPRALPRLATFLSTPSVLDQE